MHRFLFVEIMSRTRILQEAATAILAQANTDMQTVMKLLQ
jgi:flagellin-like hook-associated protein FlgL